MSGLTRRIDFLIETIRADNRAALIEIRFLFYDTVPNNILNMNPISFILQTRRTAMQRAIELLRVQMATLLPYDPNRFIYTQAINTIRQLNVNFTYAFEFIFGRFRQFYVMRPIYDQPGVYNVYPRLV